MSCSFQTYFMDVLVQCEVLCPWNLLFWANEETIWQILCALKATQTLPFTRLRWSDVFGDCNSRFVRCTILWPLLQNCQPLQRQYNVEKSYHTALKHNLTETAKKNKLKKWCYCCPPSIQRILKNEQEYPTEAIYWCSRHLEPLLLYTSVVKMCEVWSKAFLAYSSFLN